MRFEGEAPTLASSKVLSTLDLTDLVDFAAEKKKKKDVIFLQVSHFVMQS